MGLTRLSTVSDPGSATRLSSVCDTGAPAPAADWKVPYGRLATEVGLSEDLAAGHAEASAFLNPDPREPRERKVGSGTLRVDRRVAPGSRRRAGIEPHANFAHQRRGLRRQLTARSGIAGQNKAFRPTMASPSLAFSPPGG